MSIDAGLLGRLSAEAMEAIESEYGDQDDWSLRTVAIIVEVDSPKAGQFLVRSNLDRPWVLEAFVCEALESIRRMREAAAWAEVSEQIDEDEE